MKYGAIKNQTYNIGDEIQSIAAQRFYPQVDYYVYKEHLNSFNSKNNETVKMILNSWYMLKPKNFPPSKSIDPLLISMHFSPSIRKKFLTPTCVEYLKEYGPVGARDYNTLRFLEENNIPSYFSGCLTTTLVENPKLKQRYKDNPYILCAYCTQDIVDEVKKRTNKQVYYISKNYLPAIDDMERMDLAKAVLYLYHNAYCVITPNLHTALPCLAFNTPVCMLDPGRYVGDDDRPARLEGLEDLTNHFKKEDFINDKTLYNIDDPPQNPELFLKMRKSLEEKCKEFTGYDSEKSTLPDDYDPVPVLVGMMSYKKYKMRKSLYFADKKDLAWMLFKKILFKTERYDITDDTTFDFNFKNLLKKY